MSFNKLLALVVAAGAPVFAAKAEPAYVASFAAPATAAKLVSSERLWSCEGATCSAGGDATSPAKNICARIAREVGAVTGFVAKGRAFGADELAACNARAGHGPAAAVAK